MDLDTKGWRLILKGRSEDGIGVLKKYCVANDDDWPWQSYGTALIWTGKWKDAQEFFRSLNRRFPQRYASYYAWEGIAYWYMRRWKAAVECWKTTAHCGYSDATAGVPYAIMVLFAALHRPRAISVEDARVFLRNRLATRRAEANWPGIVGRYIEGAATEEEVLSTSYAGRNVRKTAQCLAELRFAQAICAKRDNDIKRYRELLEQTVRLRARQDDWMAEFDLHLARWALEESGVRLDYSAILCHEREEEVL